ncbi:MAG: hypothetical protein ACD_11C00149G0001, partial [uncultured bacterium]
MKDIYLGVDVGSVSCNVVAIDEDENLIAKTYVRTHGKPIAAIKQAFLNIKEEVSGCRVLGVGATGSGRNLAGVLVGA